MLDGAWIDKPAIRELCSRYCQTIDAQDSEGWAQCFLPHGAFEFDGHVVRGYAALREYAEAYTRVLRGRHLTLSRKSSATPAQAGSRLKTEERQ